MSAHVRYIERTQEYYLSEGYSNPYKWAHFQSVPFSPLKKALADCTVTLISSSEISHREKQLVENSEDTGVVGGYYSLDSNTPAKLLYSPSASYDSYATTLEDLGAFFPIEHLHSAVADRRIGRLAKRFYGLFNAYSQRRTLERDAPGILQRCKEDGVDVALFAPLCPVCHQTNSLVARYLEEHDIPTVVFATAKDIVEYCGVPRLVHTDFPLGNPFGEPFNTTQQREILEIGFKLLENAFLPRTTVHTPYQWSKGDAWKNMVLTKDQPWKRGEAEQKWNDRKEAYRALKREGKV